MAEFEPAYLATNKLEGMVLSNVPTDRGGMTYGGIARRMQPGAGWEGWQVIDRALTRRAAAFLPTDAEKSLLAHLHRSFFFHAFWEPANLGALPDQVVASKVYDALVNCGPAACEWLQVALNVCNRRGKLWPDLRVDGQLGPATCAAVRSACAAPDRKWLVLQVYETQQERRYFELAQHDESQEENLLGWYKHRIQFRA